MKNIINNNRGAMLIWVLCLTIVIFVIGASVITAASVSSGVAFRYRAARSSYFYNRALAKAITRNIEGFSISDSDPWCNIAQSVYEVKKTDRHEKVRIHSPELNVKLPELIEARGFEDNPVKINITLEAQTAIVDIEYSGAREGSGSPDEKDYIPPEPECLEQADVRYDMIIELRTNVNNQEYMTYLKYKFNGRTLGVPGEGAGSGLINTGKYTYEGCYDSYSFIRG